MITVSLIDTPHFWGFSALLSEHGIDAAPPLFLVRRLDFLPCRPDRVFMLRRLGVPFCAGSILGPFSCVWEFLTISNLFYRAGI
jgi:hypothetical protein